MSNKKTIGPEVRFLQINGNGASFMVVVKFWNILKELEIKITSVNYDKNQAYIHSDWGYMTVSYNQDHKFDGKCHITVKTYDLAKDRATKYIYNYISNSKKFRMSYNDAKKLLNFLK